MRLPLLLTTLGVLGLVAACTEEATAPTPAGGRPTPSETGETGGSSGEPGGPGPTTTTPPGPPPPPPEPPFVWVAPVVATTSAACGTPMPDAVHADYTTPTGRTFHVWGPSGYDPSKTYPVVMMFHGIQATGDGFETWFQMEKHVQNEAFVVYPDAKGGYWDVNGSTDLLFFDEMIKQLGETYCINPSRVLGFGFSWGGYFANQLGCKRAGHVKAISIGDGGYGGNGQKCGRLPVLVTSRTHDYDEPVSHGKNAAAQWSGLNKCGATTDVSDAQMNCVSQQACSSPGSVMFCEDTFFDPSWQTEWNHTVREPYRAFTYSWFKALP